jgi:hypothetical protein
MPRHLDSRVDELFDVAKQMRATFLLGERSYLVFVNRFLTKKLKEGQRDDET